MTDFSDFFSVFIFFSICRAFVFFSICSALPSLLFLRPFGFAGASESSVACSFYIRAVMNGDAEKLIAAAHDEEI